MSRKPIQFAIAGLALLAVVSAVYVWTRPRPVEVAVHEVEAGDVESTVANTRAGTVRACRRARLAPATSGSVSRLPVARGDSVRKGDLLLELWNDDLRSQNDLASAELRTAAATRTQVCLAADLAERESGRFERLHADGVIGAEALDRARSERDSAAAGCKAASATVEQARAQIAVARAALSRTTLRAPFDGVIAEVNAELGEVVAPSPPGIPTPPAIDLIEVGCLYVVAPIDEVDAPRVRVGQAVRVTLDAYKDRSFGGTVRKVAAYVLDREKQARTVDVEVDIDESGLIEGLVPGYSADIEVLLEARADVLRIPSESLIDGARILVLEGGRLQERAVEIGLSNWRFTEVRSGLAAGEKVVVSLDRAGVIDGALAQTERGDGG